jgi:hypothetical protein
MKIVVSKAHKLQNDLTTYANITTASRAIIVTTMQRQETLLAPLEAP